jgi:predicted DCC family thiol-disulfide oxidoreductase YuxK
MEILEKHRTHSIVFFDGVCNFCNGTVDRIYSNNKERDIFYSSLQSPFAKEFLGKHGINSTDLDTVIFYTNEKLYFRTDALIKISKHLTGIYKLASVFSILPGFLRDGAYRLFAKHRYNFFGMKETCRIPTPEEKQYFLE